MLLDRNAAVKIKNQKLKNSGIVSIDVNLKSQRKQKIIIGANLINQIEINIKAKKYDKVIIFSDSIIKKLHNDYLNEVVEVTGAIGIINIKAAPHIKDFAFLKRIIDKLISYRLNRGSAIIAIGGGTLIDLVGFVASLYMRGIDFIAIPTTLMAQGDTVIGKVGVNYEKFKHLLGSFYSPTLTFSDSYFLKSLNEQEKFNGLVEVWKHAILTRDEHLLNYFSEENFYKLKKNTGVLQNIIASSIVIKKKFVERDIFDINGKHAALSLGHTFANYLEQGGNIRHGEAILVGTIFCTFLSNRAKKLTDKKASLIFNMSRKFLKILKYNNKLIFKKVKSEEVVIESLKFDKINTVEGSYNFVVPANNGYTQLKKVSREEIKDCLILLKAFMKDNYLR
ncbi:MAG: hypothetical protein A2537_02660 [Candidatus Magasanikbacteria bacterium RIFOXYD2_FULL_36_9]|uniref:Uncharacterized protein n=1 Tax=Candidatus Magasanikbacteria bacterium RIFOXYD2_FULL_36_9 TaxID=1798707 RepID=A0A1F6P1L1_9BACT|nr:MAG: hypothetical protein A2537_02660 [Candidatus Magasanikbacteria bacterium RIFOXYD2_FULL_36_9]